MADVKHTPGEWRVLQDGTTVYPADHPYLRPPGEGECEPSKALVLGRPYIAVTSTDTRDPVEAAQARADARLIAAAPDLLEAVREAMQVLDLADAYGFYEPGSLGDADVSDCRDQLRAAHRKATGCYFAPTEIELGADEANAPDLAAATGEAP